MFISKLQLNNFRNYENEFLEFSPNLNILIGKNAQGKTNLLESILVLALTKSHRSNSDQDMITWDEKYARISGILEKKSGRKKLELIITDRGKSAKVDNEEQKKLSTYIGTMNVVLFSPDDLNLIKGSPSVRRRFIDVEFGQVSRLYLSNYSNYRKNLRQRNIYLKKIQNSNTTDFTYLDAITEQLYKFAADIVFERIKYLSDLNKLMKKIHQYIAGSAEKISLEYKTFFDLSKLDSISASDIYNTYLKNYQINKKREIKAGSTLYGPHRDDFDIKINDKNIQDFGSQGQQRTAILSLKLSELELIKEKAGEYPILLLDDVLSELDKTRQTKLLSLIQDKIQTFITTTSLSDVDESAIKNPRIYEISNGSIKGIGKGD